MSVAVQFSDQLESALEALAQDEWAVADLRERVVEGVDSATAFASVIDVLNLARAQTDPYCFASCCWLTTDLARLSNTTEQPPGLVEAVLEAFSASRPFGAENEVRKVADWYRIQLPVRLS